MNITFEREGHSLFVRVNAAHLCDGHITDFCYLINIIARDEFFGIGDWDDMNSVDLAFLIDTALENPEATICVYFGFVNDLQSFFKGLIPADAVEERPTHIICVAYIMERGEQKILLAPPEEGYQHFNS